MNLLRELPPEYVENSPLLDDRYKILFQLGTGRYSKVKMGMCMKTGQRVAIKIMNTTAATQTEGYDIVKYDNKTVKSFLNQIRMSVKSKHKHVIKILDFNVGGVYKSKNGEHKRVLYYVMKIINNGELFRLIKETEHLNERIARLIFHQLIFGLEKLHSGRISHCDIKAENILIDHKLNIKIADFGSSKYFVDLNHNKIRFDPSEPVGSLKSIPPEARNSQDNSFYYGDQIDLFACGCLLFQLVMKAQPFKEADLKDDNFIRLAKKETESFWKIFSKQRNPSVEFKDLVERLLDPNPKSRINLLEVKNHKWFLGELPSKSEYKKEMNLRMKKVGAKIRKEQEEEIRNFFKQKTAKIQMKGMSKIEMCRQIEQEIINLKHQIDHNDSSDSSSGMSAADARDRDEDWRRRSEQE